MTARVPRLGLPRPLVSLSAALLLALSACDGGGPPGADIGNRDALTRPGGAPGRATPSPPIPPYDRVPTPSQQRYQEREMMVFIHYGVTTFNGHGDGREEVDIDPILVNPPNFNPRQWVQVARETGFQALLFTAKHHIGFSLWPTATSTYDITASPWRGGQGDMLREVADATHAAGLDFGIYLSPWDMQEPTWGTAAYNDIFDAQFREVLGHYGSVFYLYLDGYHFPPERVVPYDFARFEATADELQPGIVTGVAGLNPDLHWTGNEDGIGEETNWNVRCDGQCWRPAECNVPIRPNWFWRAPEDAMVKTAEQLLDLYFKSVGRNCTFNLGLAPNSTGVLPDADVQSLRGLHTALRSIFRYNLASNRPVTASSTRSTDRGWAPSQVTDPFPGTFWAAADGVTQATLELDLAQPTSFNIIELKEPMTYGQRVARFHVEAFRGGAWTTVAHATTIGYRRLLRIPRTTATRVRLVIEEARAAPAIEQLGLYDSNLISPEVN